MYDGAKRWLAMSPKERGIPVSSGSTTNKFHLRRMISPAFSNCATFANLVFTSGYNEAITEDVTGIFPNVASIFLISTAKIVRFLIVNKIFLSFLLEILLFHVFIQGNDDQHLSGETNF